MLDHQQYQYHYPADTREFLFKILVIGELGTGKTSIVKRYVDNMFSVNYKSTIGVDFALKVVQWDPDTVVRLQLWDIAGQERFGNMTRVYYREAVAAVVVYDVTRPKTFETVAKWKADLDQKVHLPEALGGGSIPVILLANKVDLQADNGKTNLDEEKMNQFCKEHGFLKWFGTSAKDNSNIENATQFLLSEVMTIEQENAHRVVDKATMLERVNLSQSMTRSGCC